MNYDELFCYFINLLQHFSRKVGGANLEEDDSKLPDDDKKFLKALKDSGFFDNLLERHDNRYKQIIIVLSVSGDCCIRYLTKKIVEI